MMLPSSGGGLVTQEVGFFEFEHEGLARWLHGGLGDGWSFRSTSWQSLGDAVGELAPAAPLDRYACVDLGGWTLLLNNGPGGTDVGVLPVHAVRELGCRAVRAVCADGDPGYAARILTVHGPGGEPPLAIERSIVAADDGGRWVFEVSGEPYPFEDLSKYQQRTKAKRFTCEMLHEYLRHLGIPADREPDWGTAVLVRQAKRR